MVDVCKRNCALNDLPTDKVRFIVDDCTKFVERELRRGKTYDAVIMDPPSFGRGANGEVWKLEDDLDYLVKRACELLSANPLFFLINSYTTGLQPTVIKNVLQRNLDALGKTVTIDSYEIGLSTRETIALPAGCSALAVFDNRGKKG
jgi:23S rRNA (cytosine1962-C5)-methyltransferase